MRVLKYLFSNKRLYISCVFCSLLFVTVSLLSYKRFSFLKETREMLDGTSCRFIGYDSWTSESDSYAFYEDDVEVYLNDSESLLNVVSIQFLEGTEYSDFSYVNPNNITDGTYRVLKENEVALPDSFKTLFHLDVSSKIYVNEKTCNVRYFFRDIWKIQEIYQGMGSQTILLGSNTITNKPSSFVKFNPDDNVRHQDLYSVDNDLREPIHKQFFIFSFLLVLIFFLFHSLFVQALKEKGLMKAFSKLIVDGDRPFIGKLFLGEFVFAFFPMAFLTLGSFWNFLFDFAWLWLFSLTISFALSFSFNAVLLSGRRRFHE